jgi:hypothetical protein
MSSKSNPLVVFALDLMSTCEGEHTIFGLLGQAPVPFVERPYFPPLNGVSASVKEKKKKPMSVSGPVLCAPFSPARLGHCGVMNFKVRYSSSVLPSPSCSSYPRFFAFP